MVAQISVPALWVLVIIGTYVMWRLRDRDVTAVAGYAVYASVIAAVASVIVLCLG